MKIDFGIISLQYISRNNETYTTEITSVQPISTEVFILNINDIKDSTMEFEEDLANFSMDAEATYKKDKYTQTESESKPATTSDKYIQTDTNHIELNQSKKEGEYLIVNSKDEEVL